MKLSAEPLPQSEGELRKLIAKRLNAKSVPETIWSKLSLGRYVAGALEPLPTPEGVEDCLQKAEDLSQREGRSHSGVNRDRVKLKQMGTEHELARAQSLSSELSSEAREERIVTNLRARLFPTRLPTSKEAMSLLTSDPARFFPLEFFEGYKIPLCSHNSIVRNTTGNAVVGWSETEVLKISWDAGTLEVPYAREWVYEVPKTGASLMIPCNHGTGEEVRVAQWSVLSEVADASRFLTRAYPWRHDQATWFLLTDEMPFVSPAELSISGRRSTRCERVQITLRIEPWVSAATVARIYKNAQLSAAGHTQRMVGPEMYELYAFVRKHRPAGSDGRPLWEELRRKWNARNGKTHPRNGKKHPRNKNRHLYADYRDFRKAFTRAEKWVEQDLRFPGYRWLRSESTTKQR